jgi:putative DNA primase/helicase
MVITSRSRNAFADPTLPTFAGLIDRRWFAVTGRRVSTSPKELAVIPLADILRLIHITGPAFVAGDDPDDFDGDRPHYESRSAEAFRLALRLRRASKIKTYDEMCEVLQDDPECASWVAEKGERNNQRELKRVWEKVDRIGGGPPYQINLGAPYDIAKLLHELNYETDDAVRTLHYYRDGWYLWNGITFNEIGEGEIRARIYEFLDQCVVPVQIKNEWTQAPVKPDKKLVDKVLDASRALSLLSPRIAAPTWLDARTEPAPADVIACANGLLHLPTNRLLPHTPAYFNLNALNFADDPDASTPTQWLEFQGQLWPDDPEAISTLHEIIGYSLSADTGQEKIFLIVGPKRSGKGTIARVLTRLIGPDNTVAPTLAGLGTNFGLQPLIDKRVAIISDARLSGRADQAIIAERLLSISGEDGITIDRKYREAWTGRLGIRFLILSNELPRLNDASGALASRFVVLVLTETFYGREDHGLTSRLLNELPGILNLAIEGWRRLHARGYFVPPKSSEEIVAEQEDLGSPIGAFLRERCDVGAGYSASIDDLYAEWQDWCTDQGRVAAGTKQTFGRDLRAALPTMRVRRPRTKGADRVRIYEGVRLLDSKEVEL